MPHLALAFSSLLALGAGPETVTAKADLELKSADARMQIPAPQPQQITLSDKPPASVKNPPSGKSLLWGEIPFGPNIPGGVAVLIEAEHTCMSVRGVAKHGAMTFTSRFTGMFRDNPAEQQRFLSLVRGPNR